MARNHDQTPKGNDNPKNEQIEKAAELVTPQDPAGTLLTSNHGVRIADDRNSLTAGDRGPTLLEDFALREKITHFDHERIPERVVHARGAAAHGVFQVYKPLADVTCAEFLQDPALQTPVFVRFSTVGGSRGSADTVRDVRGFAVRFYTQQGNFDLVGNNMPVFFIQDAIKFPDLVHALKPEQHNEIPQASSAHDTFWDFISLTPESAHMVLWLLSDRAIPRSYRTMDGFGVNTYRLVDAQGKSNFVKFHWKTLQGAHSLVWDEAQKIAGKDSDFHRRDLWDAIETGNYPEWELGFQIVSEEEAAQLDFDILDDTKLVPEDLFPVQRVGKMTLNRNVDNYFSETEQVAFHPGHVVPGIDFSDDPLLQGRLFSYLDTQLSRLGSPNFMQIPINRPLAQVSNNQRDGHMQQAVPKGRANYEPNTLGAGCPMQAADQGGYVSYPEPLQGTKIRVRPASFADHFTQAALFWHSLTEVERTHIVEAGRFELGKVETKAIRERMVDVLANIDTELAERVAAGVGVAAPAAKATPKAQKAPGLSQIEGAPVDPKGRKVALLIADGFDINTLKALQKALNAKLVTTEVVAPRLGMIQSAQGEEVEAKKTYQTSSSVLYDGLAVPCGIASAKTLMSLGDAVHFLSEAFKHCKPIVGVGDGVKLLAAADLRGAALSTGALAADQGVITSQDTAQVNAAAEQFLEELGRHRHWNRSQKAEVPA